MKSPYRDDPVLGKRLTAEIAGWHARWGAGGGRPALQYAENGVVDTRRSAVQRHTRLDPTSAALLTRLEKPLRWDRAEEDADHAALGDLLHRGFVVQHEDKLVSVVVRTTA